MKIAAAVLGFCLWSATSSVIAGEGDATGTEAVRLSTEATHFLESGELEAATARAELAVEADVDCAHCWALLGRIQVRSRDFLAAERSLTRALDLGLDEPSLLLALGSVQWENGRAADAEATLTPLATGGTRAARLAAHQLARLWLWQGRYEAAAARLRPLVAARPDWLEARLDLARALDGAGHGVAARSHYEAYLRAVSDDAGAVYGLALLLQRSGDGDQARHWLARYEELRESERAGTMASGRRRAELDQARHLLASGRPGAAIELLQTLEPDADSLLLLARSLDASGDREQARQTLERAVARDPGRTDLRALLQEWLLDGDPS